jgi:membrane-bound serine protease (ClpP class)
MKNLLYFFIIFFFVLTLPILSSAKTAYVLPISGTIERGLVPTVERVVTEAEKANADALIVEIETFGGALQSMVEIRDILVDADLETIAFVNKRAISAGALIALACDHIVMAPGGTIGAATPVYPSSSEGMKEAGEKVVSYARNEFKSTAELKGHPIEIAEAMVDKDVEIPDPENPGEYIIPKGKLLTLSSDEAVKLNLAEHKAKDIEAIKKIYDLKDSKLVALKANWAEQLARFLTSSAISGLLLTIGMIALFIEFRTPTFGIAGITGLICLSLFFFGYYIYGLAGLEDLLLFVIGVILLGLEIFVIPGFGITGVLGITSIIGSFVMAIIKYTPDSPFFVINLTKATSIVGISLISTLVLIFILAKILPRTRSFSKLVLSSNVNVDIDDEDYIPRSKYELYLNKTGVTVTALRPSGTAIIDEKRVDVISEGGFIPADTNVKVVDVQGNKIIVREL